MTTLSVDKTRRAARIVLTLMMTTMVGIVFYKLWQPLAPPINILLNVWLIALLVLCIMSLASSTYNPFIYFRF